MSHVSDPHLGVTQVKDATCTRVTSHLGKERKAF